jgi:amphi-Trp domain-containing protein
MPNSLPSSRSALPTRTEAWPLSSMAFRMAPSLDLEEASLEDVQRYAADKPWVLPSRQLLFFCDIHADADAFSLSLEASGGVERTGHGDHDFELTSNGRRSLFIIGGDCFDKGPENLRLLSCLQHLIELGAEVNILAGNHDLRTYLGLYYAGRRETKLQHLFVRMGKKTMPLFREIWEAQRRAGEAHGALLDAAEVRRRLFPTEAWYSDFRSEAAALIPPKKLLKEIQRIREKTADLELTCKDLGMTLGEVYSALEAARRMFLRPEGQFGWYFERMNIALREGSFLFIHAGVDDAVARVLRNGGVDALNRWYKRLFDADLFELYHGPLGNAFRTKYRDIDFPLTAQGVSDLHGAGIYAMVHGHRNILRGQRLMLRQGVLNFECDASVDRNTRRLEGLEGPGGASVIFEPGGRIRAISTDYPFIKDFDPARVFELTTQTRAETTEDRDMAQTPQPDVENTNTEDPEDARSTDAAARDPRPRTKGKIKLDSVMQRSEAVAYFSALVDGLRHGQLQFRQGGEDLSLSPGEEVAVQVKASRKGDREKVAFEVEWQLGGSEELQS